MIFTRLLSLGDLSDLFIDIFEGACQSSVSSILTGSSIPEPRPHRSGDPALLSAVSK